MKPNVTRILAVLLLAVGAGAALSTAPARASIPDADIRAGSNRGGMGVFGGVYGHADYGLSDRSAIGAYAGVDPNDVYFSDFDGRDDRFHSDALIGGHYMYQFVEGGDGNPNIAGVFGAFANRAGVRPELGLALSMPLAERWTGRLNAVYGPSWGLEFGYQFTPTVEGTFGITGMGLVGVGFRF